jgi:ribosomal protein S18 acetylase RimI-like enzyme
VSRSVVPATWADQTDATLTRAATLVVDALPEFYGLISEDRRRVERAVAEQLKMSGSEIGVARQLVVDGQLAGLFTCFPLGELDGRRIVSLRSLLAIAPDRAAAQARLAAYRSSVEPVSGEGLYLSRIAVRDDRRGQGFGRLLMAALVDEARRLRQPRVVSHVRMDNAASIRLHESHGFVRMSDAAYPYSAFAVSCTG